MNVKVVAVVLYFFFLLQNGHIESSGCFIKNKITTATTKAIVTIV